MLFPYIHFHWSTAPIPALYAALLLSFSPLLKAETIISGSLAPAGSLQLTAPSGYVPGVPVMLRVELLDGSGNPDRTTWDRTVNLSASNGVVLNPSTITLTNGSGCALVTISGGSGTVVPWLNYGSGGTGSANSPSGTPGSVWRVKHDLTAATIGSFPATWKDEGFDDSAWITRPTQTGYGDNNENQSFPIVDYDAVTAGTQPGPVCLFRKTFTVDTSQLASISGQVLFDDACAVYVNGFEVYRTSPDLSPGSPLSEYTEVNIDLTREDAVADLNVPVTLLDNGENTIAVEVHQHDVGSSDISFDLRLQGNLAATDPGNFTLTATSGSLTTAKPLTSLASAPVTNASGALPAGTTQWNGVVRVTGEVIVPPGSTLSIAAGAHVLFEGTPFVPGTPAVDTNGAGLWIQGQLEVNGTAANPASLTCSQPANRWGRIRFADGSQPSTLSHCLLSRSGHSPSAGTQIPDAGGVMLLLANNAVTIDHCVLGDGVGKAMANTGSPDLTMRRSHVARFTMGPELAGASVLIEDSFITGMLAANRERGNPGDEDGLLLNNGGANTAVLRRSVLAHCDDDALNLVAANVSITDCVIRNAFDKGIAALDSNAAIRGTLITDNDTGISAVSSNTAPRTLTLTNVTIVSEAHPLNTTDATMHSVGIHTRNKQGVSSPASVIQFDVRDSIIAGHQPVLVDAPYPSTNTSLSFVLTYDDDSAGEPPWPGTGNLAGDPLFVSLAGKDFRLTASSPARDSGDPASPLDADGTRADRGALPFGSGAATDEHHWTLAGSPYHVTGETTVPAGLLLRIHAGVAVQFDRNVQLIVRGRLIADGREDARIVFSHVPGAVAPGDADPIRNGTQTGPPKWGGVRIYDSMAAVNIVRHCEFLNAQGTSLSGSENYGSLGFIRSWGLVEFCTWTGTHLRMCYGRNPKLTVRRCVFPDMFVFDPALGRIENPTDFLAAANNNQEHLKVEFPTGDPELAGNPNFVDGQPAGGFWRVYYNHFYSNRGHNDVFDGDSGRWGQPGQLVLDCRYNHFHGPSGDEHIDLGGDAYVASNIFEAGHKDPWGTDFRYSSAISSGDRGTGTTIMVARNLFFDLDHGINLSQNTATIFEHNTVANMHEDFLYTIGAQTQTVENSVVNFFIPEDGANPTYGDGGYLGFNLISKVPHMFSGPDARKVGGVEVNDITTKIEFHHNLISDITDPVIGPNHPAGLFSGTYGPNTQGLPGFVDPGNKDYSLRPDSPARGRAPGGFDYGYTIPEWAYIAGGPAPRTLATTAHFKIGGPGLVAYKWRLNGGAWSVPLTIGNGGNFPRGATPTVRQSILGLSSLAAGPQLLEVLGQDMAGNWQDADPARTVEGLPQAAPTVRTWTVYPPAELLSDNDGDGLPLLTELALGRDPLSPETGGNLPASATSGTGQPGMQFQVPVNDSATGGYGADEITCVVNASDDLTTWTTIALKAPTAEWTGSAAVETGSPRDGLVTIGIFLPSAERRRFLRLNLVHTP